MATLKHGIKRSQRFLFYKSEIDTNKEIYDIINCISSCSKRCKVGVRGRRCVCVCTRVCVCVCVHMRASARACVCVAATDTDH